MTEISNNPLDQLALRPEQQAPKKNELGQDEFLKLMLTQIKHQDPFKPMENGEFIGQMAQFSTVSGIEKMQVSLDTMSSTFTSNQVLQASSLVGRNVLVPGNTGTLQEEGTIEGAYDLPASSGNVFMNVYDPSGNLVQQVALGAQQSGQNKFSWDGTMQDGSQATTGNYLVGIEYSTDGTTVAAETLMQARIESVNFSAQGNDFTLTTSNGQNLLLNEVRQIQ